MKKFILLLLSTVLIWSCSSSGGDEPIEKNTFTISLSTSSITFPDTKINETSELTFKINNTGNQTITFSDIATPTGFSVTPISGSIATGASKTITLTFEPIDVKSYSGGIFITSNATNNNNLNCSGDGVSNSAIIANYETNIKPIMSQSCGSTNTNSCHGAAKASGVQLTSYALVKAEFQDNSSAGPLAQIESGSMPRNSSKLPQSTIDIIKNWINNDFQEN
ncbi:DUF1573 domain-containing protein [Bacteroidota bacterium]